MPAKCPGNDGDFVFRSTHTIKQTYTHTYRQQRQADKQYTTQQQWRSNKAWKAGKTAGKAGQKDMRLLLLLLLLVRKVTETERGEGLAKMTTRMNLAAQIKIISSCL